MADPVEYLKEAHRRAEELAQGINPGWWPGVALETRARAQECTPKRAFLGLVLSDEDARRMTELFDLLAPTAVLARVTAERAILAACQEVLAVGGWEYDDAPQLADATVQLLAAGWGWTEEPS